MNNILIAGGDGFIGYNLQQKLAENPDNNILIIDDYSTGVVHENNNVRRIYGDISKINLTQIPVLKKISIDCIYNLASPASPLQYKQQPIHTIETNTNGVINLLNLAEQKEAVYIQASTSEIYGEAEIPFKEESKSITDPFNYKSCYIQSKILAETITNTYQQEKNVNTKIIRIFNTYGENMRLNDGRVIPTFIKQAIQQEPLTIHGNGEQTRSFLYISDLINALTKLPYITDHKPINIGNTAEMTINTLAYLICKKTNNYNTNNQLEKVLNTVNIDTPYTKDTKRRKPDITRAKRILNWKPQVNIHDGLHKTILSYKKS